jgi:hypothetical protein
MRWERQLLRIGEYLVGRACRRLPGKVRDERYREWTAELPAILHDPDTRLAAHRAVRMLCYAVDTIRGTALTSGQARRRPARRAAVIGLRIIPHLVAGAFLIWVAVKTPGNRVHFFLVALLAYGGARLIMGWVRRRRRT